MSKYVAVVWVVLLLLATSVSAQEYEVWKDPQTGKEYYKWRDADGHLITSDFGPSSARGSAYQKTLEQFSVRRENGPVVGHTPTGKPIYEGPRGGRYHVSEGGNKEYHHPRSGDNGPVVGHTATGKPIYEGPRGGRYHISEGGNKAYHPSRSSGSSRGGRR